MAWWALVRLQVSVVEAFVISVLMRVVTDTKPAPHVGADADDTAKTILALNLLGCSTSPRTLLQEFEDKTHFKTYQQERDPSFSANCNVLNALLHVENPSDYTPQIAKTLEFLCDTFRSSDKTVRDKWVSGLY